MQQLKILNSKERKKIQKILDSRFDSDFKLNYEVFMNPKNKIFIITKDISKIDLNELRINSLGMYFGVLYENTIRLSIEGSEIVGKTAKKNFLELNDRDADLWMSGQDFEIDSNLSGFIIIKHNNYFLGCGKMVSGKLYNYVPKERRA